MISNNKININKTAVALGFFDGVHNGHLAILNACTARKDFVPVAFTFKNGKTAGLLMTHEQKISALKKNNIKRILDPDFSEIKNLSPCDFFKRFLVEKLNAAVIVCGEDFRFGKNREGDVSTLKNFCSEFNLEIQIIKSVFHDNIKISSSIIREKLKNGEIKEIFEMGFIPEYIFEVLHGRKLARNLNSPTINQKFPENIIIPRYGVYKSRAYLQNGEVFDAISNVGIKPTFNNSDNNLLLESNLINFNRELYGETVKIRLLDFIRPEKKFENFNELKLQIEKDKLKAFGEDFNGKN